MRMWELLENKNNILDKIPSVTKNKLFFIHSLFSPVYELRIVGGSPRDLLMGIVPKDYDLSTTAIPEIIIEIGNDYNNRKDNDKRYEYIKVIPTGLQHGTVTYNIDNEDFEITTLRKDITSDGRHAEVSFNNVTWEDDAARRDLTMNSISIDFNGKIYDYFGGIDDLKKNRARFVGNADSRIQEDYLRILRYFRFQGRLPTPKFDKETLAAIERNANGLEQISGERIWMEMSKILSSNHVMDILDKIKDTGVDLYIDLPSYDTKIVSKIKKNTNNPVILLAAMIQTDKQAVDLASKWKLNTYDRELMRFVVNNRFGRFTEDEAKDMWTNSKIKKEYVIELARYFGKPDLITKLQNWKTPEFPVTGQILIQAGLKPGPQMGSILKRLEKEWKESGYTKEWSQEELEKEIDETL